MNKEQEQENKLIEELKNTLLEVVEFENDVIAVYALLEAAKRIASLSEHNKMFVDEAIGEVFERGILSNEEFKEYVEEKTGCQLV